MLCTHATSTQPAPFIIKSNLAAPADAGVTMEQVEASVLWLTADKKQLWQSKAFSEIASTWTLTRPFAWIFKFGFADRAYHAFAMRRFDVSAWFGLGTCGIAHKMEPFVLTSDATFFSRKWFARIGGALLFVIFVTFVIQTDAQNRAVPQQYKMAPPNWVKDIVEYTHFYQGWGMFSVSPNTDGTVIVRAKTVDGRLVDPLSERAARASPLAETFIPDRLDHSEFFCDYLSRIAGDPPYHPPLRDWILAYPKRTGNPNDTIQSFEVVSITDHTPPPGQQANFGIEQQVILSYP